MTYSHYAAAYTKYSIKYLILLIIIALSLGIYSQPAITAIDRSDTEKLLSYSDVADLIQASPLVINARIKSLKKVKIASVETEITPRRYLLVRAELISLIRGQNGLPQIVTFLANLDDEKTIYRKKNRVLLFASLERAEGQVRLVSRHAAQPWTPELEAMVRSITAEILMNDSPPAITGIGDAFFSSGTIAGEGETQIFLKTQSGAPISLSILRRPGQATRWGVSLGEIVDEAAVPPARNTLLWYRLACGLPPRLPYESIRTLPLRNAESAQRDYQFVIESLGSCGRTL